MTSDRIAELIRKLRDKASSAEAIGSVEEAALFAAKVQELLLKHQMTMDELDLNEASDEDRRIDMEHDYFEAWAGKKSTSARSEKWERALLNTIAVNHACRVVFTDTGWVKAALFGLNVDRIVVKYLFAILQQAGSRLAEAEVERQMPGREALKAWRAACKADPTMPRKHPEMEAKIQAMLRRDRPVHRNSFLIGFVRMISQRLRENRERVLREAGKGAIVNFLGTYEAAKKFAEDVMGPTSKIWGKPKIDPDSYNAGKEAGKSVPLGGIGGAKTTRHRAIGRGQQMLPPGRG